MDGSHRADRVARAALRWGLSKTSAAPGQKARAAAASSARLFRVVVEELQRRFGDEAVAGLGRVRSIPEEVAVGV